MSGNCGGATLHAFSGADWSADKTVKKVRQRRYDAAWVTSHQCLDKAPDHSSHTHSRGRAPRRQPCCHGVHGCTRSCPLNLEESQRCTVFGVPCGVKKGRHTSTSSTLWLREAIRGNELLVEELATRGEPVRSRCDTPHKVRGQSC